MLTDREWKTVYRTGDDDILNNFYLPALGEAKYYDRAVGYFASQLLVNAATGLSSLIKSDGKMRLIIGHPLDADEYEAIKKGGNESWLLNLLQERLIEALSDQATNISEYRLNLLSWLVACGRLEIRFACRKKGMYHEKIGIITDKEGNKIIFQGSANETVYAMDVSINSESISVYPSWTDAYGAYGKFYEDAFEKLWDGKQKDTITLELPSKAYEIIASKAAQRAAPDLNVESDIEYQDQLIDGLVGISNEPKIPAVINGKKFDIRDHQIKALESWKSNDFRGILKLATGSGKTITAIFGAIRIYQSWKRLCLIVAVPYVELAKQWLTNLKIFNINAHQCFDSKVVWYEKLANDINLFATGHILFLPIVVVNRTLTSPSFQKLVVKIDNESMLFVGDECHRHGSEKTHKMLPNAKLRLGLSATPFQDDDDEIETPFPNINKERITNYYGGIVTEYTLSDAINDNVLVPYKYHIHAVHLTPEEQDQYEEISRKIANALAASSTATERSSEKQGLAMLFGQRSRLLGEAEGKFKELKGILDGDNGKSRGHCLFYCPEGSSENNEVSQRNIDRVSKILNEYNWRTSQFTSYESKSDRQKIMQTFFAGGIDALVSMKVLDEGIDIPACRTAFILASTRNPRQYVQRRGRILRKSENKKFSVIHDFVILPAIGSEDAALSRRLIRAEMERVYDFLSLALNKREVDEELKRIGVA